MGRHEFNNLLTAINGDAGLAFAAFSDKGGLQNHLEEIRKAGQRAADLTQ